MVKLPKISIVIPLYVVSNRFFADLSKFEKLNYPNFELLMVCDKQISFPKLKKVKVRFLLTGKKKTGPAEKRDLALKHSKADLLAFIDDDAYPSSHWLYKSVLWFKNPDVVAVGGPGLTPPEDSYWEKIGGYIVESYLCSGGIQNRYYVGNAKGMELMPRFVVDWPAYNLIVRADVLRKVGGYGSRFYGGEDTYLCMKLIKYGRIIADPEVVVYHHRRAFPKDHLKQIGNVGLHRGYFFKKYPKNSRSIIYLLPTFLTAGLLGVLTLSILSPSLFLIPLIALLIFFWSLAAWSVKRHKVASLPALIAGLGVILTHIIYGAFFVKGFLTRKVIR